jgi:hypothetical protein
MLYVYTWPYTFFMLCIYLLALFQIYVKWPTNNFDLLAFIRISKSRYMYSQPSFKYVHDDHDKH